MPRPVLPLLLALLAACGASDASPGGQTAADSTTGSAAATPAPSAAWRSSPAAGVTVSGATAAGFTLETRPHVILWPADGAELAPPYSVRGTLEKTSGRIHEGVGLIFGGTGLEGAESGQAYSYFLTRGDGSFLIKQRRGAETPVVRDWTSHPAIRRDASGVGRANELRVDVGTAETVFYANGAEVARVPTAELQTRGRAGVRASHDVHLRVSGFTATADAGAVAPSAAGAPDPVRSATP